MKNNETKHEGQNTVKVGPNDENEHPLGSYKLEKRKTNGKIS